MTATRRRDPAPGLRRFVGRVALFLVPLAMGATLLLAVEPPRAFAWWFVRGDTRGRGVGIYRRAVEDTQPVDAVFVGTSATWYGVDDEAIERALGTSGRSWRVLNCGYGRNGRNLDYVIARDQLEVRDVRHLFVEVRADEHEGSHPIFGFTAGTEDLLGAPFVADEGYVVDLYRGLGTRLDAARHQLLRLPWSLPADVDPHGILRFPEERTESVAVLDRAWARRHAKGAKRGESAGTRMRRPRHYVQELAELAARRGTALHFFYLPTYGYPWAEMRHRALYEEFGDIWIPPEAIFREKSNWRDADHLNRSGQAPLAAWLAARLAELD